MLTRSKVSILQTLSSIKSNVLQMNTYMNLVRIYYINEYKSINSIIELCLNDEQLNKIKNKRIIIYNNDNKLQSDKLFNEYSYGELLGYKKIAYDYNIVQKYNKNNEKIIKSIENNLLDDFTIDLLLDDEDVEAAKILQSIKYN